MIKKIFVILMSICFATPSFATVRRVAAKKNVAVDQVVIEQKVYKFQPNRIEYVQIPVTSYYPQYYYEADRSAILGRKIELSDEDIDRIIQGVTNGIISQLDVVDENGEPINPVTPVVPDQPDSPPVSNSEIEAAVLDLFHNKCASCHSGDSPKGKLLLVNSDDSIGNLTDRQISQVLRRTRGGHGLSPEKIMPLGGDQLSDEEIDLLQAWQDERFAQPAVVAEITE